MIHCGMQLKSWRGVCVPYSGKFSLGANFRDFCEQTCFRKNQNCEKNSLRFKLMMSLRAYVEYPCEQDGSLQSVRPLNGCCREESASYCTQYHPNLKMSHQPVGVWSVRPTFHENKNRKISSEESGRFSAKNLYQ